MNHAERYLYQAERAEACWYERGGAHCSRIWTGLCFVCNVREFGRTQQHLLEALRNHRHSEAKP